VAKDLSFFVEGRNLSNKTYASTTGVIVNAGGKDQSQFNPGDGRAVYAGIEWRM
jgi:iron complex outermembrane receptor protein